MIECYRSDGRKRKLCKLHMILYLIKELSNSRQVKGYKSRFLQRLRKKLHPANRNSFSSLVEIPSLDDGEFVILSTESNSNRDMICE